MLIAAGIFLVMNGLFDFQFATRQGNSWDLLLGVAGIVFGVLILLGVGY